MNDPHIPKYRLETQAEVANRSGRSSSTISAMRDPEDPRFDPAFPEPVPVGPLSNPFASIRFESSEVDAWIESRMKMRPGKYGPSRCTNTTSGVEGPAQD